MTLKADIVIVGSGIAGIAAAIAARREGKDVLLIDKRNSVGGDSAYANVGTICGAYYRSFQATPGVAGYEFTKELIEALHHRDSKARPFMHTEGLHIIPYEWTILQQLYSDMLREAGLASMMDTKLKNVSVKDNIITELQVLQNDTLTNIQVRCVIDCSGQALVSQLAGIETIKEKTYQAASQVFRLVGVAETADYSLNMALKRAVLKNSSHMQWPASYKSISIVPGSLKDGRADLKFTLPDVVNDELINSKEFIVSCEHRTKELFTVLKSEVTSLKDAGLEEIFPQPGIRIVQRSKGKYILTEMDVMTCRNHDDYIAIGTWPVEEWHNDSSLMMEYFEIDKGYQIPSRCLQSDIIRNLYFGGKNISATAKAIASARVMGTAIQTGYAAGKLACADSESQHKTIVEKLQHELQSVR